MATRFDDWEGDFLAHHGIKGQKWGQRRWQNEDGSLTSAGRAHYGYGEGGSKKMGRVYNRQLRKLNKLAAKADVNAQKAAAEKYDKRASKAVKVGNIAAGATAALTLGKHGMTRLAKHLDDKVVASNHNEIRRLMDANNKAYEEQAANNRLVKSGDMSSKYAKRLNNDISERHSADRQRIHMEEYNSRVANANKRDIVETIRDAKKYAAYAAGATAAISYGVAAYNKIQSKAAKARTTDKGHAKAVEKYKKQYSKMMDQFANTPYAELVKKQRKKV